MTAREFTDLVVWQQAHALVLEIYRLSSAFPKAEQYGLTAQVRRAAVSVPANIAEGFAKRSKIEKLRFYNIAQGSLEECRYYLILINDLGYGDTQALSAQLADVGRRLGAYIRSIQASNS